MLDLATIGIAVETEGVRRARDELGRFVGGADKAGDAADRLGSKSLGMSKAMQAAVAGAKLLGGAFAAWRVADLIRDSVMLAARYETMGVVMRIAGNNAGYTMAQMTKLTGELQKQGISMLQSRNAVTQLATANIDLAKASDIGRAAQNLAVVANTNSSDAMGRMIHGIKSGEVEILRTLGLNVSFEASYKKLGAQIGVNSKDLTEQQKVLARTNAVLEESKRYNGIYEESLTTAGKAIGSLTRYWEDLKVKMGEAFLPALATAVFTFTDAIKAANAEMDRSKGSVQDLGDSLNGGLTTALEAVAILAANVAYVFNGVGREIGGMAAQIASIDLTWVDALIPGMAAIKAYRSFSGGQAASIRKDMQADNQAAENTLAIFERRVLNAKKINASLKGAEGYNEPRYQRAGFGGDKEGRALAASAASKDAAAAETAAASAAAAASDKRAKAGKAAASALEQAMKSSRDFVQSLREEAEEAGLSDEQLRMLNASRAAALAPTAALRTEIMAEALTTLQATQAAEAHTLATKTLADAKEAARKATSDAHNAALAELDTLEQAAAADLEQIARIGKTAAELVEMTAAKFEATAASKELTAATLAEFEPGNELVGLYLRQADALRLRAGAARTNGKRTAEQEMFDKAKKESDDFWRSVDQTAHEVFINVANEGEDAFKRIGKTLKAAILDMLYQMTIKKWIFQISGQMSGGNATTAGSLLDSASSAYSAYTTAAGGGAGAGAGAVGGSASAVGSWAGGSMSTANMAGSVYANTTGTGINGLLSTNGAYGTAASGAGGAGGAGASWGAYAGYAAWIAVAIMIADKMYDVGHNRTALGEKSTKGGDMNSTAQHAYGHGNTTTGDNGARFALSKGPGMQLTDAGRKFYDAIGVSEKWADILSGTSRMATLVGRRLKGYGFQAQISGADVDVKGYEFYKGGVFRSNKTTTKDVDSRDVTAVRSMVDDVRASAKAMGMALGHSTEAIDAYTGSLKINFKGADSAAEVNKRVGEAMDELKLKMLNAIPGIHMTKEKLTEFVASLDKMASDVGISAAGMTDILVQGMIGRMSTAQVGEQLSEMVIGGIYKSIAGGFASQIGNAFMGQIIQPIMASVMAGGTVSNAVSQASINGVLATAKNAMAQFNAIVSDPAFKNMMADLQKTLGGLAGISTSSAGHVRSYGTAVSASAAAAQAAAAAARAAAEALKREWASMADSMSDEIRRLKGEVVSRSPAGMAYHQAQFAIANAKAMAGDKNAAEMLPELSRVITDMAHENSASIGELVSIQAGQINSLTATRNFISQKFGLTIPAFADGGMHAGGARLVGEDGPEIEVTGPARYYSSSQTSAMLGGGNNNSAELAVEIRALRVEVATQRALLSRIASATHNTDLSNAAQETIARAAQNGSRPVYTKAIA